MAKSISGDEPLSTSYLGHCHCNLITFHVTFPTEVTSALSCDCSLCRRNGALLVYPAKGDFVLDDGCEVNLTEYTFGERRNRHVFCKGCGGCIGCERMTDTPFGEKGTWCVNVSTRP